MPIQQMSSCRWAAEDVSEERSLVEETLTIVLAGEINIIAFQLKINSIAKLTSLMHTCIITHFNNSLP